MQSVHTDMSLGHCSLESRDAEVSAAVLLRGVSNKSERSTSSRRRHPDSRDKMRMRADPLGEAGGPGCLLDDAGELARADRLDRILAREQPAARQHRALAAALEPPC